MFCLPCIFLPVLLAIYLKFIQPYVYRILPQRWVEFLDPILYPTCPAKPPAPEASGSDICQFVIFGKIYYKKYLLCRSSEKERGRIEWLNTLDPPADVMISWGKRAPATKRDASAEASKWTVVILLASAGR
ncbi:hypothetical protein Q1695_009263 [Nippostrongylus brasiliensis]|nr:hypothetical protein Q1695_009263 [Nippostrongylus brasiliensis]